MLTGKPPFAGETALAVAVQHLKREPKPLESQRPDLPPALCRIVHKMLAKDPTQRWQSARELLRELCRVRMEYGGEVSPEDLSQWEAAGIEPLADRRLQAAQHLDGLMRNAAAAGFGRWGRLLTAGAILAAVLAGGGVAWLAVRPRPLLAAGQPGQLRIHRQPTAARQCYYASQIGTEEAWQAVIEYFPEKEYYVCRAKQQLARIYLREYDFDRAMVIFDELSRAGRRGSRVPCIWIWPGSAAFSRCRASARSRPRYWISFGPSISTFAMPRCAKCSIM